MPKQDQPTQTDLQDDKEKTNENSRLTRIEAARKVSRYLKILEQDLSQRQAVKEVGGSRNALRNLLRPIGKSRFLPKIEAFFNSEVGIHLLHVILIGLIYCFNLKGGCGMRRIIEFLEITGLSDFVACSLGTLQKIVTGIEKETVAIGEELTKELGAQMAPKDITVVLDETFMRGDTYLVALEAVSNFILLEEGAEKRDSATWKKSMDKATEHLPHINMIQCTSDEGTGILAFVEQAMAHHSPDLFHGQHELCKTMAAPLAVGVRRAGEAVQNAQKGLQEANEAPEKWGQQEHGPGRPPNFAKRCDEAQEELREAECGQAEAKGLQDLFRATNRKLGTDYHPVNLFSGKLQTSEQIGCLIQESLAVAQTVAEKADLPERCYKSIAKTARLLPGQMATVDFFFKETRKCFERLGLPEPKIDFLMNRALPQAYLRKAAKKAPLAETRKSIEAVADKLDHDLGERKDEKTKAMLLLSQQPEVKKAIDDAANLFQRSSSSVEGRNSTLALHHHSWRRLPPRRLAALTVLRNFTTLNEDNKTPAQRFFGADHPSMFHELLIRLPLPARPAERRSRPQRPLPPCLAAAA